MYDDLRELAARYLSRQRRDHTLQPTALVHEAYLRLAQHERLAGQDRAVVMCIAAKAMRSVLVDHARRRHALKRNAGQRVPLDEVLDVYEERAMDLVAIDDALARLANVDPVLAQIVDLRFFGGLTVDETAAALGVCERTVRRDWQVARAWLYREMTKSGPNDRQDACTTA